MKRNPTLPPYLCWVTRSLHQTYKTTLLKVDEVYVGFCATYVCV
ncbi:hypothetical protein [Nostoc sp. LEGE 12450]|nr:hypothetical protein [Nostoc sp. LEGE 12450]